MKLIYAVVLTTPEDADCYLFEAKVDARHCAQDIVTAFNMGYLPARLPGGFDDLLEGEAKELRKGTVLTAHTCEICPEGKYPKEKSCRASHRSSRKPPRRSSKKQ